MLAKRLSRKWLLVSAVVFLSGLVLPRDGTFAPTVSADSTPQSIPFSQDWSSTGQMTGDDNWAGVPGIVGFRGDDYFVPTRFVDTLAMETASDEWLGDSDGDGLAELALGRLPVRTAAEASRIVDKIVSYDGAPMTRSILLVSDLNDGIDFESEFSRVRPLVPDDVQMRHISRGELGTAAAKSQLIESLNRGVGILGYFGHGSIDQWRGDLFTSADAGALSNGEVPLVFAITCLNGYFQDPALDSLAESLLLAERGGAVAVWATSGMCDSEPQAIMDQ